MKFTKKPVTIEAITFDELVEHGKASGAEIVSGMPWSFEYNGYPITHENDECYLIPALEGTHHMTPKDMLITGVKGEIYPFKRDIFELTYSEGEGDAGIVSIGSFSWALMRLKEGGYVRLPSWAEDVRICAQFPDENSKMTAPYLYVESRFGCVPWKETMIELFAENWEEFDYWEEGE